jgi:putative nucleotidyltransferase with HDIG domain
MGRSGLAASIGVAGSLGCLAWAGAEGFDLDRPGLLIAIGIAGFAANISDAHAGQGRFYVSGSFLAYMLAVAFSTTAAAFVVVTAAEVGAWLVERYRWRSMAINVFGSAAPFMVGAAIFHGLDLSPGGFEFYWVLALLATAVIVANMTLTGLLGASLHDEPLFSRLRAAPSLAPAVGINILLAVAAASVYHEVGLGGAIFVLVSVAAFTYMAHLLEQARERARQYAALSWGVLSGLVRTLDIRDPRASRHSAAVAAYARDIARAAGMSDEDVELAHTAGLLHDIGRFALSDRVMERGRPLTNEDWAAIRRHPELGAEMLADLGLYGNVAEIVHAHHERVDGRGYPQRLKGDEIPEIAKIVAVAEVYDTLTADDTYRTPISSFEALTELRRVAGTQLDARYVETLSEVLAGRGVEYRHAREASFEQELDLERRIGEAASS